MVLVIIGTAMYGYSSASVTPMALMWIGSAETWGYYAVKKVFVKFFAKFFEVFAKFFKVFASFSRFSRVFEAFGSIRTQWDAFGCIRKQLEAFGRFRKILRFFGFLSCFSTFPDVIFTKDFFHGTIISVLPSFINHNYETFVNLQMLLTKMGPIFPPG